MEQTQNTKIDLKAFWHLEYEKLGISISGEKSIIKKLGRRAGKRIREKMAGE